MGKSLKSFKKKKFGILSARPYLRTNSNSCANKTNKNLPSTGKSCRRVMSCMQRFSNEDIKPRNKLIDLMKFSSKKASLRKISMLLESATSEIQTKRIKSTENSIAEIVALLE